MTTPDECSEEFARQHVLVVAQGIRTTAAEMRKRVDELPPPLPHFVSEVYHSGYRTGVHAACDALNEWAKNLETVASSKENR